MFEILLAVVTTEPTIGELGSPHMTTPNIGGHTPTHAVADTQV